MRVMVLAALGAYKRWLSPMLPPSCRFEPSCSAYAAAAVTQHGVIAGGLLAAWRVLRCHPFTHGGFDPVPENLFHQHSHTYKR
jgi:uncharacterized protein